MLPENDVNLSIPAGLRSHLTVIPRFLIDAIVAIHVDTWSQPPASPTHMSQNTGKLEWQQLRRQVISVCRRNYVTRVRLSRFPEPERAWSWPGDSCFETMKVSVIFSLPAIEHEGTRSNNMTGKINKIGKKV